MDSGKIFNFVRNNLYQLNEPQVYMKDINQDFYGADDWKEDAVHFCLNMPVEASASIANQGMAILYDCINRRMIEDQDHFQMSRGYFPEPKLLKAMKKEGIPHFDKETFHQMRDFDIVGFSSFYAMQYLSLPQLIELSNIPLETKDRGNSLTDHPIVIMGGIQAYSASPLFPCLDLICVGEGEEQLPALLRLFRKAKSEGYTRKQFLIEAAKNIQGILVPQFYKEEYYPSNHETKPNQISFVGLTEEGKELGIPPVVLKACVDFANTPICTKPFVTCAEGAEMSIGSCFVANGCGNFCSFCQGSALAAPYRERREEDIKQAFWDIKRNTGCDEAVPYSFNISDLSCVNEISRFILEELHCSLSFSSERLDQMNEDFIKCMRLSGSRSATVAIESASPRGRKILNKNLSEKQILDAFEIMFKAKLSSIKIYNISSFAFCQKEDIDYYPILMKKLDDLRQKYNPKTKLRLSFTPFQAKPFTPLMWAGCTIFEILEDGNLEMIKNMDVVFEACRELNFKGRVGTSSSVTAVAHALCWGDRRMWEVIKEVIHSGKFKYGGGMGLGGELEDFTQIMKDKAGLGWDYFFREKDLDEIFTFDIISNGIKKEYLKKIFLAAKAASQEPVTTEGLLRLPCYEKCTGCGVCQDKRLPKFMKPDHSNDITEVADKITWTKPVKNRILRFIIDIKPEYRYADASKLKYHARKALFNCNVPIINSLRLASDVQLFNDWTGGYDILEVEIPNKRYEIDERNLPRILSEHCEAFKFVSAHVYTVGATNIRSNFDAVLYSIDIPTSDYSYLSVLSKINGFNNSPYFEIKIKEKGDKRDSTQVVKYNAHDLCDFITARQYSNFTRVFVALKGVAGPYDMLTALLKTSKRKVLAYVALRKEYLLKDSSEGTLGMFSDSCVDCGAEIETNMLGEAISENYCLKCKCVKEDF